VVDDDRPMLRVLSTGLRAYGFPVVTAADAGSALDLAARRPPEAVLLDLRLPDLDGMEVLRSLRASGDVPVLVVSGRAGVTARIEALDAGADDYVTKPFAIGELAARLRAVLRRPALPRARERVTLGPYLVDLAACTITRDDGAAAADEVRLTPTEWRLLALLLRSPHRLVPGRHLLAEIWGPDHVGHTNYLRVYVAGLRRKLEADPAHPRHLITEPGLGYRFQP
jgi:two-component system KDP operon response regulator KdpE